LREILLQNRIPAALSLKDTAKNRALLRAAQAAMAARD
jgi:hypothetical protein